MARRGIVRNVVASCFGGVLLSAAPAMAGDLAVHVGRLIDGTGAAPVQNVTIVIHGDRITAIEHGFTAPAGATVIDLSRATVLPGLIDCHDHITASFHKGDPIRNTVTRTTYDDEVDGINNARAELMAGFTTIRDVGAVTPVVVAIKRAVNAGLIAGPRMWVSGEALGPTGGHGDPANGLDPELMHTHWTDSVIDSPEEARKAVRRLRREGADLIKIMPSGGVMSIGDDPKIQLMSDDEIKAVIDTAHGLGMKVAAHAHGEGAINHTIELGVDSIEHGSFADAKSYALMKSHGTYLVPTMLVGARVEEHVANDPLDKVDFTGTESGEFSQTCYPNCDPGGKVHQQAIKVLEAIATVGSVFVPVEGIAIKGLGALGRALGIGEKVVEAVKVGSAVERGALSEAQATNLARFESKVPANSGSTTITAGENGSVTVSATSPGKVPGSSATYTKTIGADGKTIPGSYTKTTVAPNGEIVHVKIKN